MNIREGKRNRKRKKERKKEREKERKKEERYKKQREKIEIGNARKGKREDRVLHECTCIQASAN
jgi:hypothetical protein